VVDKLRKKDYKVELVSGSGTVPEVLSRIDQEKPEALYLAPLNLSGADRQALIDGINQRKIPSFSFIGYEDVEKGVLAGRIPKLFTKLARRLAINIDRIFRGEDAGTLSTRFDIEDKFVVNQRTANEIGHSFPFNVLMNAEVLFQDDAGGGKLTLHQAVNEALQSNLNFRIVDEQIKAVGKDHLLAWTTYLPLIQFRLDYGIVDSETAKTSFGATPKEGFNYGISLNQLIFSHPVFLTIRNAKKQVKIEKLNKSTTELDITDQTVRAYLNYLRAKALRKVEQDNLKAIKVNLAVSQKRKQTGVGGKEEVLRWEAESADKQADLLQRDSAVFSSPSHLKSAYEPGPRRAVR